MLLISSLTKADGFGLDIKTITQKDGIADKLKEGEVCKRDLVDTREALDECANQIGDSHAGTHIMGGVFSGIVITFLTCSLTHVCN